MFKRMTDLLTRLGMVLALGCAVSYAQVAVTNSLAQFNAHVNFAGAPPVGTGCTIAAGSSDTAGKCTASAASGSIAFANTYTNAPNCLVTDGSATSTVSMPVYTTTATQITLTTIISTHVLYWFCPGTSGGT